MQTSRKTYYLERALRVGIGAPASDFGYYTSRLTFYVNKTTKDVSYSVEGSAWLSLQAGLPSGEGPLGEVWTGAGPGTPAGWAAPVVAGGALMSFNANLSAGGAPVTTYWASNNQSSLPLQFCVGVAKVAKRLTVTIRQNTLTVPAVITVVQNGVTLTALTVMVPPGSVL